MLNAQPTHLRNPSIVVRQRESTTVSQAPASDHSSSQHSEVDVSASGQAAFSTTARGYFDHQPPHMLKGLFEGVATPVEQLEAALDHMHATIESYLLVGDDLDAWVSIMTASSNVVSQWNSDDYWNIKDFLFKHYSDDNGKAQLLGMLLSPLQKKVLSEAVSDNRHFENSAINEHIYRLVIDGERQPQAYQEYHLLDEFRFNRSEPGYLHGMLDGLIVMLKTLDRPLTSSMFEQLHDTCIDKVFNNKGLLFEKGFYTQDGAVGFNLVELVNCTSDGITEFLERNGDDVIFFKDIDEYYDKQLSCRDAIWHLFYPDANTREGILDDYDACPGTIVLEFRRAQKDRHETIALVDKILDDYHRTIAQLTCENNVTVDEDAVLAAIVHCCQSLDQLHVFSDANIRTSVFLVMNKLLLQQDMCPAIVDAPNVFDAFDTAALVGLVKQGQSRFKSFLA